MTIRQESVQVNYKTQLGQSVTQCRKVLGHKGANALTTEPLVASTSSAKKDVRRCVSSYFTSCVELNSCIHPDACTATNKDIYSRSPSKSGSSVKKILTPKWNG